MSQQPVSVTVFDSIASVNIDHPPVNALSVGVRQGLLDALEQTEANAQVKAVILICNGRTFIAGADIKEFGKPPKEPSLPDLILKIEAASKPWVAAIHGTALGGGLEVALGCRYRIASSSAKLGLPEVNLGLLPGAGGTVRLPKLIGAEAALDIIFRGKPIDAARAMKVGLVDGISENKLFDDAIVFANRVLQEQPRASIVNQPVPTITDRASWDQKIQQLKAKSKNQHAQLSILRAVENTVELPWQDALQKERELFVELRDGEQSAAMRYLFMAERSATRLPSIKDVQPLPLSNLGVVGGGTMGAGIAAACLLAGFQVTMIERNSEALQAGIQRVQKTLDSSLQRKLISEDQHQSMLATFQGDTDYKALSAADLVIEAVYEDMEVKKAAFALLEQHTKPNAILASNTSYLDVNQIAQGIDVPARVIGLHFFSPAHIMKLLELVIPDSADNTTIATGFALGKQLRKICVPAGVCDGFIGNRIMSSYRRVCDEMLVDGAMPQEIDAAMTDFGFPMGIFQMQDMAGLDIAWAMRKRRAANRHPDERYVRIADRLCELGRFGKKTGRGWYTYEGQNTAGELDNEVTAIIIEESASEGVQRQTFSADKIMTTILNTMQDEGKKVLAEGIAKSPEAIDVVMVNGYGFPRRRGGPMFIANA